jgi:hypothetical protein
LASVGDFGEEEEEGKEREISRPNQLHTVVIVAQGCMKEIYFALLAGSRFQTKLVTKILDSFVKQKQEQYYHLHVLEKIEVMANRTVKLCRLTLL